ncbi:hypothetical protein G6R40_08325 [Chryseobacterium sp. POL2]|uniref:DUF1281 family ferredoxin-like fold protein n=1 Tax=Chryseobacterium TaxID=59732 RepID=UPI0013E10D84|nr:MULTISPECIES: hypothetical protein [Chryseobacterium]MDM1554249.1 hypothetical protein [Chryseobacterium indologenes]QIG89669.1 hypothetical protein G6R40_08325 [Chryseobacterium sp. POL2]
MANWCNNTVVFEGHPKAIEQINGLFKSMADSQKIDDVGQLPDFIQDSDGDYFYNIEQYEGLTNEFHYETKYTPNTETVKWIAEHFKVDFTLEYEELGCKEYGKVIFEGGILTDISLDQQDIDSFTLDEATDTYYFEGEEYDSECEILETLLERKIENHFNSIKSQAIKKPS